TFMCRADPRLVQQTFALSSIDTASLSPWACVHRARTTGGRDVVVKRTASSQQRAEAMAGWTTALARAGVRVVTPVDLEVPNPALIEQEWWVVYPFIDGRGYDAAGPGDVRAAGALLGQIHAAPVDAAVLAALRG